MKKINEFDKNIIRYSLFLSLIMTIILIVLCIIFSWPLTYVLGFILCYIVNIVGFLKSNHCIDNVLSRVNENPKKSMIINNLTNNLMYAVVLLINLFFDCFNVFIGLIGLFVIKTVVIFKYGLKTNE